MLFLIREILKHRDAGLIVACVALGYRGRFGGIGLGGAVLAHLVAQGFAVGPGVRKDTRHYLASGAADHDLNAAVLRLAHVVAGRYQQLGLALADHGDGVSRDALANQLVLHRVRAPERQGHIVAVRAGGVGVTGRRDAGVAGGPEGRDRLGDHVQRSRRKPRAIPVEEHHEGRGLRHGLLRRRRWRWRRLRGASAQQERRRKYNQ